MVVDLCSAESVGLRAVYVHTYISMQLSVKVDDWEQAASVYYCVSLYLPLLLALPSIFVCERSPLCRRAV